MVYTFIGEPLIEHFQKHHLNQNPGLQFSISHQYYCHICYPPSDNPSFELANFLGWIYERGAYSGSFITEQLFEDLIITDFTTVPARELRIRVIRLLNTLTYQNKHTADDQIYFLYSTIDYINNKEYQEENNPSDDHYSETTFEDQHIQEFNQYPEFNIFIEELTMANINDVVNSIGQLVAALGNRNNEKVLIPICKFKGENQDPVEWLKDFEVATTANGITNARKMQIVRGYLEGPAAVWFDKKQLATATILNDWTNNAHDEHEFKSQFMSYFRTQRKIDAWQDELETLQQTGTVEQYSNKFTQLIQRIDPDGDYPVEYKTRTYLRGLKPEIRKLVKISNFGTLEEMIDAAKIIEDAENEIPKKSYHQTSTQPPLDLSNLTAALENFTNRLNNLESGYNRPNQFQNNNWRNTNRPPITCYNCSEVGHTSRICTKPYNAENYHRNAGQNRNNWNNQNQQNGNNNNQPRQNTTQNQQQNTLTSNVDNNAALLTQLAPLVQALQTLTNTQQATPSSSTSSNLLAPHDYLVNERKKCRVKETNDIIMESDTDEPPKVSILPPEMQELLVPDQTAEIIPPVKVQRKKKGKAILPVLASKVPSYDIVEDLASVKANITIGQLIKTSPEQRLKMSKGMRKPMQPKRVKKRKAGMTAQKTRMTSAWCEAKIGNVPIDLIIDTGASGCVASNEFLK